MSSFDPVTSHDHSFQMEAVVKWFSLPKGFGFIAPIDGSSDAFMHSSVMNRAGLREIAEGTKLLVEITDGPKGRQVAAILNVLGMGVIPPSSHDRSHPVPQGPGVKMSGIVKWFKPDKGFGFVTPDDGDRDVFVHRSVLQQAGIEQLQSGERVNMNVHSAAKGREATWIEKA